MKKLKLPIILVVGLVFHLRITFVRTTSTEGLCDYIYDRNRYTCNLHNAVITSPDQVLTITGNHLPNSSDSDVQAVIHHNVSIAYFNGEVLRKFTNLEYLALGGAGVSQINGNAFSVCGKLDYVYIGSNSLQTFPPAMLQNCVNLRHFSAMSNRLASIPEDLFGSTTNLEIFDVTSNPLLSSLPANLLRNMRNLKQLYIRSNSFAYIDRDLLVNAANLETVDLSGNSIFNASVVTNLLNGLGTLISIRLIGNRLTSFDFTFFAQFTELTQLEIGGELSLTGIDWTGLPTSLTSIHVSNIGEEIPADAFNHLTKLKSLGFTGAGVTNLHEDTFKQLAQLDVLAIQSTRIESIPSNIFVNQTNLKQLFLSFSYIDEFPEGLFASLVNLGFNRTSFDTEP